MLNEFINYLTNEGKSKNTIGNYKRYIEKYYNWFKGSFGDEPKKLYRQNILEFRAYLQTREFNNKTINGIISSLIKYNEFLIDSKVQDDMVISKKDMLRVQQQYASPTDVTKEDIETFRQNVLESEGNRNYAIVTILAYAGLRISECLDLKLNDVDINLRRIRVRDGKGSKERFIPMSLKISEALKIYLKERKEDGSDYLFTSNKGGRIDRSVINKVFNKYSDKITPHKLRHFFCTNALESKEFTINEVASMAGHSNIHTTLIYTNPNEQAMLNKIDKL